MSPAGAAVIGCGVIGNRRARALAACGVRIVAVHDVDETTAGAMARTLDDHPNVAASASAAIATPGVDLVVIATSHASLAPLAVEAVVAGRSVLVEKPGAHTLGGIEELAAVAREQGSVVRVGYNHRFHPSLRRAKALVESGRHGPLLHVRARYGHGGRLGYESEWRAQRAVSGGGELLDQGSHLIDLTRYLAGDVELVFCELRTEYWAMEVEDNAYLALRTTGGGFAWLHASWSEWKNLFSFEITLREAKLEITGLGGSYGPERLTLYEMGANLGPPEATTWEWPAGDDSWTLEVEDVLAALRGAASQGAGIEDALAAFRVIDQAYSE